MTREPIEVTRQDRIYCLKASSDYHRELCEECRFYPNCDHVTQDDMTELTIEDLEALEQEPCKDAVSVASVFEIMGNLMSIPYDFDRSITEKDVSESMDKIRALPRVTPQEPFKPMVEIDLYSVIKQKYIEREVLDEIRAEIEEQVLESLSDGGDDWFTAEKVNECLEIIDKYKAESEGEE